MFRGRASNCAAPPQSYKERLICLKAAKVARSRADLLASDRQYRDLRQEEILDYIVEESAVLYILAENLMMTPEVYFAALELAKQTETVRWLSEQVSTAK